MKYVSLSFDDGRSDTYEIALPILRKYGLSATVNIISDFVLNPNKYQFKSASNPMSKEQIIEWQNVGYEVACHGSIHKNTRENILKNINELELFGVNVQNIGFASPSSYITEENVKELGILELQKEGLLFYIRSGIQVRREGWVYIFLSMIEKFTHSKVLYWILNKRSVLKPHNLPIVLPSVAIKNYHTFKQVKFFIEHVPDGEAIIIMLHSILHRNNKFYGSDYYYWDVNRFELLCEYLAKSSNLKTVTTKELVKEYL